MKVWVVTRVMPFGFGRSGNQIVSIHKKGKDARRIASQSVYLIATPYKLAKKIEKTEKLPEEEAHG